MYIIKEKDITPMPPSKFIDNAKVKLIGKHFDYYDNYYILPAVIEMVRPDYSLYNVEERNSYANASTLQFLHGTQLLPARQDYINYAAKYHKKTVIVDEML
jgi:galactokinase